MTMRAVVVGASGGIGSALAETLRTRDWIVRGLSRRAKAEGDLPVDILDEGSIAAAAAVLALDPEPPSLVIVATGVLQDDATSPEKSMRALDSARLAYSFAVNAIGPALVAKHLLPLLPRDGRSVFAVLSARVGSIADNRLGGWYGYRTSKAALNQMVRTLAIEMRRTHPDAIVVALHPGTVATALSAPFRDAAADGVFQAATTAVHLLATLDGLTVDQSGGFFAWDGHAVPF